MKVCLRVDTGRKLNVHKTFRRRPGRLLNALCTLSLRPVSTGLYQPLPKKLYQFITNLFFLANIPTPGRIYKVEKNLAPNCLLSWLSGITERYLPLQYYTCKEVHADKARKNKSVGSCTCWRNKLNFASNCLISFKIKQQDLIVQKSENVK